MTPELRATMKAEWAKIGKRPDILVGDTPRCAPAQAWFAIESRSSFMLSNEQYQTVNKGKSLSVTVKLEDIVPQTAWILATGCPLVVVQVLFAPEAYAISWNDVLRECLTATVTRDRRSQKDTFFLPLTSPAVHRLGTLATPERWDSRPVQTPAGKMEFWPAPANVGQIGLTGADLAMLRAILRS
jgi:hypothetical protein